MAQTLKPAARVTGNNTANNNVKRNLGGPKTSADNNQQPSDLINHGTLREFIKLHGLKVGTKVQASKSEFKNPTIRIMAIKDNEDMELLAGQVGGIVMSQSAGELYPVGTKIDIDAVSVSFGSILDEAGNPTDIQRYIITTGDTFLDGDEWDSAQEEEA